MTGYSRPPTGLPEVVIASSVRQGHIVTVVISRRNVRPRPSRRRRHRTTRGGLRGAARLGQRTKSATSAPCWPVLPRTWPPVRSRNRFRRPCGRLAGLNAGHLRLARDICDLGLRERFWPLPGVLYRGSSTAVSSTISWVGSVQVCLTFYVGAVSWTPAWPPPFSGHWPSISLSNDGRLRCSGDRTVVRGER